MGEVHGAFTGCVMPASRIEAMIASKVRKTHIKCVPEAYFTRWWDYRLMSPGHSFMLFAHHYYRSFKIYARKMLAYRPRDGRLRGLIGGIATEYTAAEIWEREPVHISGMWNAMLAADGLGMPYPDYCSLVFQEAIAAAWTHLPYPNQMCAPKIAAPALMAWEGSRADTFKQAKHPIYLIENYDGLALQDEYRAWAIAEIKAMNNPRGALAQTLFINPQIPEELARSAFPPGLIDTARAIA